MHNATSPYIPLLSILVSFCTLLLCFDELHRASQWFGELRRSTTNKKCNFFWGKKVLRRGLTQLSGNNSREKPWEGCGFRKKKRNKTTPKKELSIPSVIKNTTMFAVSPSSFSPSPLFHSLFSIFAFLLFFLTFLIAARANQ